MTRIEVMIKRANDEQCRAIKALRKAEQHEEEMVLLTYEIIKEALAEGLTIFPYDYHEIRALVDSHKFLDTASIYSVIMEQLRNS